MFAGLIGLMAGAACTQIRAGENPEGGISRQALEYYLCRAVTHAGLCNRRGASSAATLKEDLRMLRHIGARFIGRAAFVWAIPKDDEEHFRLAEEAARKIHRAEPGMILQAAIFEIVDTRADTIPVPPWVFEEFGLPAEGRHFRYEDMLYRDGRFHNHWEPGASVPDITRMETRMWFYYRARRYIDAGFEALHFGQVELIGAADKDYLLWRDLLARVRRYAREDARRRLVLCDAHVPSGGIVYEDGTLLFDFHSFPLRIKEVESQPQKAVLEKGHLDSLVGRSRGGTTPSGWRCESLPFLLEIDNWGASGKAGESVGGIWVWGYDEISWFSHQDEAYRNAWLRYAHDWVRRSDANAFLQMPTRRVLANPVGKVHTYQANTPGPQCPDGFNQEETIRSIWAER